MRNTPEPAHRPDPLTKRRTDAEALEELRMLSNINADKNQVLQLI